MRGLRGAEEKGVRELEPTIRFLIRGQVQGVGFRAFVRRAARAEALAGWVRNLRDGTVECEARGSVEALDRFRVHLSQGPPGSRVVGVEESAVAGQELPEFFEIR
jgi:acylphosphatase